MLLGSIEAGGTKFVCAVGTEQGEVIEKVTIPTRNPQETIADVTHFFSDKNITALGVGSFGPVDLDRNSKTYGNILNTPKLSWRNYPFLQKLKSIFSVPIAFSTDVNIATLGEYAYGAAKKLSGCLYITVGTGIGAGAILDGELLNGFSHPEMGHIIVRRHPDDHFEGICPYHKDCLEGLASGPAIRERWGQEGSELSDLQEVWNLEAYYLAQAIVQFIMILAPEKIIIGGGVSKQKTLFLLIRKNVKEMINGYINHSKLSDELDEYIVPPALGQNAGIIGGLELARIKVADMN